MENLEKEWIEYPVLDFDMSTTKHADKEQLLQELKLDKNTAGVMEQINLKNYPEPFALCGLPIVKVAVNFDSERCILGDWKIEKV